MSEPIRQFNYRNDKENANAVKSTDGRGNVYVYKPNKKGREGRKRIWDRYQAMKDNTIRKEEEKQWELGDKMYSMWSPEREPDDWRADIVLPDGFSAVQSHMQETIDLRPRPHLEGVEESDAQLEIFNDKIYQYAMDKTDFDIESYKARNCSAIRGTAFTREEYRYETRTVRIPTSFKEGKFEYEEREIIDYDDVYTRWIDNSNVFWDPDADDPKYMNDWIYREVMSYEAYCDTYHDRPGFINTKDVVAAKHVPKGAGFFQQSDDMSDNDVEVLHYENKRTDSYDVLANNVLIRQDALPSRHKELSLDVWPFYPVPGRICGMGIPRIIYTLVEERRTIRNLSVDRQKLHLHKTFLTSDIFDLDEEELAPRLNGVVSVNTNGQPLSNVIMPLEYGDVPGSSLRMDEMLKEDERRAHGLDDRPAIQAGGTATEAAIVKESAQRRINLINTLSNWSTLTRLGKKKWSNIQFHYATPRVERIMEKNEWKNKTIHRTIKVKGMSFNLVGDPKNGEKLTLRAAPASGFTRIKLDKTYAQFMDGNYDIVVDAAANVVVSKPIRRANVMETAQLFMNTPLGARLDLDKASRRILSVTDESPADWLRGNDLDPEQMREIAEHENHLFRVMAEKGQIYDLPATPGADQGHTEVHLDFANSEAFKFLPAPVQEIIKKHIMDEVNGNPALGNITEQKPGGQAGQGGQPAPSGGDVVAPGAPGGPAAITPDMGDMMAGGDVTSGQAVA